MNCLLSKPVEIVIDNKASYVYVHVQINLLIISNVLKKLMLN